jgi:hypothetical protein
VEIRFISSLSSEDEDGLAEAIMSGLCAILDSLSIAYTMRIETTSSKVFQHSHPAVRPPAAPVRAIARPHVADWVSRLP